MLNDSLELLIVSRAAEMLQVPTSEVYALCQSDRLKHFRIGLGRGTIRICRQELIDYLQTCRGTGTKKPVAHTQERRAVSTIRPLKHITLCRVPAVLPDGDDQAADTNVNSER